MRCIALALIGVLAILWQGAAKAEDAELESFFGTWTGVGITEQVSESGEFSYTSRDLDVVIRPEREGFSITWTAEERDEEGYLIRRTGNLAFISLGDGVFKSMEPPGRELAHERTWARISDRSLIIYVFEIDKNGVYELSRYVRTLTSLDQMQLGYTRDYDGRPVRGVVGQMTRANE